mmetsp:Transcript_61984/g.192124  ORF Transcript_61984/g.192124 Transcript_61984/m.192124 type:complete len:240 (-) Transcript_61984:2-721(-)
MRAPGEAAGTVHVPRVDDAHLLRDGLGCRWVVARDHHHAHVRAVALGDGLPDPGAGRVPEADPPEEGEARGRKVWRIHVEGKVAAELRGRQRALAEAKDPLALGGGLLDGTQDGRARGVGELLLTLWTPNQSAAPLQHPLRGALHEQQPIPLVRHLVNREHELVGAVKGQLRQLGEAQARGLRVGRGAGGRLLAVVAEQCRVGGVTDDLAAAAAGSAVAEEHRADELPVFGRRCRPREL